MELTNLHRDHIYESANSVMKFLYEMPESGRRLREIADRYRIIEHENYKKFALLVGDVVLGFYKIEDTVPLLQQELGLDAKTAALLGADVLDFLAPLSDPNFVVPEDDAADFEGGSSVEETTVETETPPENTGANPVYVAMQNAAPSVTEVYAPAIPTPYTHPTVIAPEIHTMATDAAVVRGSYQPVSADDSTPTHVSAQPTFTRPPLSDTPSYATPASPHPDSTPTPIIQQPRWGN